MEITGNPHCCRDSFTSICMSCSPTNNDYFSKCSLRIDTALFIIENDAEYCKLLKEDPDNESKYITEFCKKFNMCKKDIYGVIRRCFGNKIVNETIKNFDEREKKSRNRHRYEIYTGYPEYSQYKIRTSVPMRNYMPFINVYDSCWISENEARLVFKRAIYEVTKLYCKSYCVYLVLTELIDNVVTKKIIDAYCNGKYHDLSLYNNTRHTLAQYYKRSSRIRNIEFIKYGNYLINGKNPVNGSRTDGGGTPWNWSEYESEYKKLY